MFTLRVSTFFFLICSVTAATNLRGLSGDAFASSSEETPSCPANMPDPGSDCPVDASLQCSYEYIKVPKALGNGGCHKKNFTCEPITFCDCVQPGMWLCSSAGVGFDCSNGVPDWAGELCEDP